MKPNTHEKWQRLLDQQIQSGLTVAEFCHQQQLSTSTFYQKKKALMKEANSASAFIEVKPKKVIQQKSSKPVSQPNFDVSSRVCPIWLAEFIKALA